MTGSRFIGQPWRSDDGVFNAGVSYDIFHYRLIGVHMTEEPL